MLAYFHHSCGILPTCYASSVKDIWLRMEEIVIHFVSTYLWYHTHVTNTVPSDTKYYTIFFCHKIVCLLSLVYFSFFLHKSQNEGWFCLRSWARTLEVVSVGLSMIPDVEGSIKWLFWKWKKQKHYWWAKIRFYSSKSHTSWNSMICVFLPVGCCVFVFVFLFSLPLECCHCVNISVDAQPTSGYN